MSKHQWCQDVPRDEAVRAAEDAAAVPSIQHRDLPEQVALLWASVTDILGRVVRLEAEMDAGEAEEAAPAACDPAFPGEGIRTERVTLEFHIKGPPPTQWPWSYILRRSDAFRMLPGESVRVVEDATIGSGDVFADVACGSTGDEVQRLTAERDAARAEAERLKAQVYELQTKEIGILKKLVEERDAVSLSLEVALDRVHELEATAKADFAEHERLRARVAELEDATAAGGEAKQEPVAWGCRYVTGDWHPCIYISHELAGRSCPHNGTVVPLYAAPPEPRGCLTAEEREWLENEASRISRHLDAVAQMDTIGSAIDPQQMRKDVALLRSLLARETPPRVKVPHLDDLARAVADSFEVTCKAWIDAIRAAGGEVEE